MPTSQHDRQIHHAAGSERGAAELAEGLCVCLGQASGHHFPKNSGTSKPPPGWTKPLPVSCILALSAAEMMSSS